MEYKDYLVVDVTQTPLPSVSALMHISPVPLQSFGQELAFFDGIDVFSARKFHTNLEVSPT